MATTERRLVIVGNPAETHVGRHLHRAAELLNIPTTLCDVSEAYRAPRALQAVNWHLRGRRPSRLAVFGRQVLDECRRRSANFLLATGIAPLDGKTLREAGRLGLRRVNFLTDDPWNPAHRAEWFLNALPEYDEVFTPREANMGDLRGAGCQRVTYLPFAYAPDVHFPDPPATPEERARFSADVVFVGGGDPDRVPWIAPLIAAGLDMALYGGYWDRYPETRRQARGLADAKTVRKATGGALMSLCLVRHANRDGHSMRSFETPATGACMLMEDTAEHRRIFGEDGVAVQYVESPDDVISHALRLRTNPDERGRMAQAARVLIAGNGRWQDRLQTMLGTDESC